MDWARPCRLSGHCTLSSEAMLMHRAFAKINMKQETVHENMPVKDFPNNSDSARIELWRRERLHNRLYSTLH